MLTRRDKVEIIVGAILTALFIIGTVLLMRVAAASSFYSHDETIQQTMSFWTYLSEWF